MPKEIHDGEKNHRDVTFALAVSYKVLYVPTHQESSWQELGNFTANAIWISFFISQT